MRPANKSKRLILITFFSEKNIVAFVPNESQRFGQLAINPYTLSDGIALMSTIPLRFSTLDRANPAARLR